MSKRIDRAIEVAKATMMGDLRDVCLDILKNGNLLGGKAWKDLKESDQRHVVDMLENKAKTAVIRAIDIIASEGRRHVKAQLKSVTVKDGIKIAAECVKSTELRHDLMDAQGDTVLIVLTSSDKYSGEKSRPKLDKDQPDLPMENNDGAKAQIPHDPETGEIKEPADTSETDDEDEEDDDDFDNDGERERYP